MPRVCCSVIALLWCISTVCGQSADTLVVARGDTVLRPNRPLSGALFPYRLNWKVDVPVAMAVVGIGSVSLSVSPRYMSPQQVMDLDPQDLPAIDRFSVGRDSHTADLTSDWLQYGMVAGAAISTGVFSRMKGKEFATLFTMYVEAFAANLAVSYAFKNAISRPRPYVYNDNFTGPDFRNSDFQSMISAHASTSFMSAVFISKTFSDLHPHSKLRPLVWTVTLSAATAASVLRLLAGEHFATDIIAGAAVGAGIGYLVPWLHKKTIWLGKQKKARLKLSLYSMYGSLGLSSRVYL